MYVYLNIHINVIQFIWFHIVMKALTICGIKHYNLIAILYIQVFGGHVL